MPWKNIEFCVRNWNPFLDATSHLYKRVCPSVRRSVRRSVGPLVAHIFLNHGNSTNLTNLNCKSDKSDRIWQIWQISLCNSILVAYFRRIFVQTNLFQCTNDQAVGHPRQAGSEGYFKKLSKGVFFWDYRHPLGPKWLLFYDFFDKCATGAL